MKRNTLVHATAGENGISLRTVSRLYKSPHGFYIMRQKLADLENVQEIISHDINSFAVLTVVLSYDKLATFLHDSATGGSAE